MKSVLEVFLVLFPIALLFAQCEKEPDQNDIVDIPDQTIDGDSLILNLAEYFDYDVGTSKIYTVTEKSEPFAISTKIIDSLLVLKCISSYLSSDITLTATSGFDVRTAEFKVSGSRHNQLVKDTAEVNGTKVYYEMTGSGDPLVFIHIFPVDCRSWNYQLDQLAQHFKIIRYDMAGYGKSADPVQGKKTIDNLKALLDFLGVSEAHLCGACVGSAVAIDFCLGYPDYCKSVISVAPFVWGHDSQATRYVHEITGIANQMFLDQGRYAALDYFIRGNPTFQNAIQNPETQEILMEIGMEYSWWHANHSYNGIVDEQAVDHLDMIKKPILVITADNDIIPSKEVAEIMDLDIQDSKVVNIPDAGHFMWLDKPSQFNQMILDFLGTVPDQ